MKIYFDERWIACKERQADNDDSEQYRVDALDMRRQLGIGDKVLSTEPTISNESWEKIYTIYTKVSNELRIIQEPNNLSKEESKKSDNKGVINTTVIDTPAKEAKSIKISSQKQEIRYRDYTIVYFPQKKDIVIKNTDEYSVRLKHGVFPEGSDYELRDGHLYLTDEDIATPFMLTTENGKLNIIVLNNSTYTGISFSFDIS